MKDHILNSSSQHFTHSTNLHRLYVVTGKGGVGKSSVALALTKHLHDIGKKVVYHSFDQGPTSLLAEKLNIPNFQLDLDDSSKEYIGNKLGNQILASWIMKTPFFKSLLNMLPGLAHMILFGHVVSKIEKDPDLIIVMDSPSSGHAMTMFESSFNFKEIFQSGLLVKDIDRMHEFIHSPNVLKTFVLTLPTLMATHEGLELQKFLKDKEVKNVDILLNDSLACSEEVLNSTEVLPDFLKRKIELEQSVIEEMKSEINGTLPHITTNSPEDVIVQLTEKVGALL